MMFAQNNRWSLMGSIVILMILQANYILCNYHIFDITRLVNSDSENSSSIKLDQTLSASVSCDSRFYYKTDLPMKNFIETKLGLVTTFLDKLVPTCRVNFMLDLTFISSPASLYKDETLELSPGTERINGIVVNLEIGPRVSYPVRRRKTWLNSSVDIILNSVYSSSNKSQDLELDIAEGQFLFVTLTVTQSDFAPSYEMFKAYWKKVVYETNAKMESTAVNIIYNVQFIPTITATGVEENSKVFQKYRHFIASISAQLAIEENQHFISEIFTANGKLTFTDGDKLNQASFLVPTYNLYEEYWVYLIPHCLEEEHGFPNTLYMREETWQCVLYCLKISNTSPDARCEKNCPFRQEISHNLNQTKLNLIIDSYPNISSTQKAYPSYNTDFAVIQTFAANTQDPPIASIQELKRLGSGKTFIRTNRIDPKSKTSNPNLCKDGTSVQWNIPTFYDTTNEYFHVTDIFLWKLPLELQLLKANNFDHDVVSNQVYKMLELVDRERVEFIQKYPGKTIMYSFDTGTPFRDDNYQYQSVYCKIAERRKNQFLESLVNWAALRDVRLQLGYVFEWRILDGWFGRANPPDGLIQRQETFTPLLRNYPSSMSWLGKLDPCIERTVQIPEVGIVFNKNLSGVVLNLVSMKDTPLTVNELKTMLHFVSYKFSRVTIQVEGEVENVKKLETAFILVLEEIRKSKNKIYDMPEIYLEIQFSLEKSTTDSQHSVGNLVKTLKDNNIPVGIHATVQEKEALIKEAVDGIENELEQFTKAGVNIGVGFVDCVSGLNNYLNDTDTRKKFPVNIKYIVCQDHDIMTEYSVKQTTKLLHGQFVIRNAFKRLFPHLEQVHFQLFPKNAEPLNMLRFYSDVNKFAEGHEMSYFYGPAFDDPQSKSSGWWRIENYEDLSNSSIYVDKEAEYLKKATWRPEIFETSWLTTVLWSVLVAVTALFLASCGSLFYFWKRSRLLTDEEVREFLQGKRMAEEGLELRSQNDISAIGFNSDFEIPKVHNVLDSCPILGMGNFGTVVKTTIRNETVALKIPNDGCSKDSFKSMLVEVKLLCYIGEHINVIKFVGAYVKEISKGVIQIATVICENGSLQSFLREKQKETLGQEADSELVRELTQFAKEIAAGMAYIGNKKVVHGDLSTRNVLLDGNNTCKIADFGLSRKLYEYNKYVKTTHEPLPWKWMAYETLKRMEFTTMSDMWSYGVTLWEIFSLGDVPYPGLNWTVGFVDEIFNGLKMTMPQFSTLEIYDRMSSCWNIEPETRPTFEDMHGFFVELTNSDYKVLNEI